MITLEQIQENRGKIKTAFKGCDYIKYLHVDRLINSWEELFQSAEWIEMWDGWSGQKSREILYTKLEFIQGFIIDGKIYVEYKLEEGLKVFKELTLHTILSNAGFHDVAFLEMCMMVMITKRNYENTPSNRKILVKRGMTITTEYFSYEK